MQISVDVHNYMETLVGQVLEQDEYRDQFSLEQLADLACLALNQTRPVYIRHDIDFLAALSESRLLKLKQSAETAVIAAKSLVLNDRRSAREEEVPTVFNHSGYDEESELEWFEKPILPKS
ncbi:competence protein ComFB [Vibrio sinensis]|uniref:Competence protein ComFB n=1 Tax=Vibrio sinensis TaxID=2302434 RepID=A0A3A6R487_9VIBR|nr:late competence development ComFB family protein [Vibrio sinensis]RJX75789.1 competence protein ComFB [Vibrio sinensis]